MARSCFHPSLPGSGCTGGRCCSHSTTTKLPPCTRQRVLEGWHGDNAALSWGRRVVVQPGRTHLHSKSSHGSTAGTWDWGQQGPTCPVLSASSAEQMFRRAWLPETSTGSLVARACKESQRRSTAKTPSSMRNQHLQMQAAQWLLGTSVSRWELLDPLASILHSLPSLSQSLSQG